MAQHHKWSKDEIENMIPWELAIYMELLMAHIEEERERLKQLQNNK
jgi:hypothetical protein